MVNGDWMVPSQLNRELSGDALKVIDMFPQEREVRSFLLEVAYAVSALSDSEFEGLPSEDPTYSDINVGYENVVDFAEWRDLNYSANANPSFRFGVRTCHSKRTSASVCKTSLWEDQ